ncbi:MAG: DUF4112 domain-containing protein [Bacteroidota bacterium]
MQQSQDLAPSFAESVPQLQWVDKASQLLDTKFRIPGTDIRFGADFLLGLFPGAGDLISYGFSGILVITMARHGASPMLAARMLLNIALDALVGTVPVLGNIFDLFYKANYRNVELMKEFYAEGAHQGSVWPVVLGVIVALFGILVLVIWGIVALLGGVWSAVVG